MRQKSQPKIATPLCAGACRLQLICVMPFWRWIGSAYCSKSLQVPMKTCPLKPATFRMLPAEDAVAAAVVDVVAAAVVVADAAVDAEEGVVVGATPQGGLVVGERLFK